MYKPNVYTPGVDFARNRKLTFKRTMRLISSMQGGLLKKLYDFEKIHKIDIIASAFVQQRSEISNEVFRAALDVFG